MAVTATNSNGAKQAPQATRAATKSAFGDVPSNEDAKQPDPAPKLAVTQSKGETPPDADTKTAPADAGIVDFVGWLDDDEQFADMLEEMYGQLGLLQDGWRQKAEEAYRDAATRHINPDYQA